MSFWEGLGVALGKLAAQAQEIQKYQGEYKSLSNKELVEEFKQLKKRKESWLAPKEIELRYSAVYSLLKDRGIISNRGD